MAMRDFMHSNGHEINDERRILVADCCDMFKRLSVLKSSRNLDAVLVALSLEALRIMHKDLLSLFRDPS
jgi:hypothetical protein